MGVQGSGYRVHDLGFGVLKSYLYEGLRARRWAQRKLRPIDTRCVSARFARSLGFRVYGLRIRGQGLGFRNHGSGFKVYNIGFRVRGLGFRVQGSGFRVQGIQSKVSS